jgi:endonuclease YncB( thermonuclease family)
MAATLFAATARAAENHPAANHTCKPAPLGDAVVQTVVDGRTVRLTDGREVRLAGIDVPSRDDAAARAAKAALESAVIGHRIALLRLGSGSDRYGRTVALIADQPGPSTEPAEITKTVQWSLLAQGLARVAARVGDMACAVELLAAEQRARAAGLGLWTDPYYVIGKAEDPAGILAARGHLAVVEGKVLSVRESGSTIYVNFGRRWSDDFTVTVPKRNKRTFTAAGLDLKALAGHRVRVRGILEERAGPWIEVTRPEQIEIAESQ